MASPASPSSSRKREFDEPTCLNTDMCSKSLVVSTDKLTVRYTEHGQMAGAIQANRPAPRQRPLYYFEMTVKDCGQDGAVAIGFTDEYIFKNWRLPGWDVNSYGYHGDDGKLFLGDDSQGEPYAQGFTTGDTVGAGIRYATQEIFFTRNGKFLSCIHNDVKTSLYPTVGLHSPNETVEVNFGHREFMFDVEAMKLNATSRDDGHVVRKHRVFLSNSGAQKGFVEHLDADLRQCDQNPFFDRDRDSLPIGEPFPPHILKAIQHCQVGVVVLSEEFLSSKWPMLELVKLVQTMKEKPEEMKIMPVFLSIICEDLGNEQKLRGWKAKWDVWANDERLSIAEMESALRFVKSLNGLVFNPRVGEMRLQEEIVKEICKIVPPVHRWVDSHVQGRTRLRQVILKKVEGMPLSQSYGPQVVGLYGVGGIGKTTACKYLCEDLFMKFGGKVCHVEFGSGITEEDRLQEVLKRLTNTNKKVLENLNKKQQWTRLNDLMKKEKVFLAIDNISDSKSIDEAKKYLQAGYCSGSIVMVTSRALGHLTYMRIDKSACFEMPRLGKDEAMALFLYHAEPRTEVDKKVLNRCIKRCYFSKGNNKLRSSHYHPLALKVLGSELGAEDPKEWKLQLKEVDVFNQRRERENPVFSILRRSFDELRDEDKLLFMDVALFDIEDDYKSWRETRGSVSRAADFHDDGVDGSWSYRYAKLARLQEPSRTWYIFDWLSMVHGLSVTVVKDRLKSLKKKSLLEDLGDGLAQIGMHDLWREFAVMETKRGEEESWLWVHEIVSGEAVESALSSGGWKNLRRISVTRDKTLAWGHYGFEGFESSVKCLDFSDCSKATVLKLVYVDVENNKLNLIALKQLKSLEIIRSSAKTSSIVSGIVLLTNLKVLIWLGVDSESAVEEISHLTNLEVLQLASYNEDVSTTLDLGMQSKLREVRVQFLGQMTISGLSSRMNNLRVLDLGGCKRLQSCPGVDDAIRLEELVFRGCSDLKELPNLRKLTRLRILDLEECYLLKAVPGLGNLVALQYLWAFLCVELEEVPDLSNLTNLQVLDLGYCKSLKCIPGLGNLIALQEFSASGSCLEVLPGEGKLTKLQRADIGYGPDIWKTGFLPHHEHLIQFHSDILRPLGADYEQVLINIQEQAVLDLAILESAKELVLSAVPYELTNLGKLARVQNLQIWNCGFKDLSGLRNMIALKVLELFNCSVERLPDMGNDMRLESLRIIRCSKLEDRWDGVGGSGGSRTGLGLMCNWTLPRLKILEFHDSGSVELPDLSSFPRLKSLKLRHGPEPGNLDFALRCHSEHRKLEVLLLKISTIKELPDLRMFPRLRSLKLLQCYSLTRLSSSEPLRSLKYLHLNGCERSLRALPDANLFPSLRDEDRKAFEKWREWCLQINCISLKCLVPLLQPCLHPEQFDQLRASYLLLKRNEITKDDFFRGARIIVGDQVLGQIIRWMRECMRWRITIQQVHEKTMLRQFYSFTRAETSRSRDHTNTGAWWATDEFAMNESSTNECTAGGLEWGMGDPSPGLDSSSAGGVLCSEEVTDASDSENESSAYGHEPGAVPRWEETWEFEDDNVVHSLPPGTRSPALDPMIPSQHGRPLRPFESSRALAYLLTPLSIQILLLLLTILICCCSIFCWCFLLS